MVFAECLSFSCQCCSTCTPHSSLIRRSSWRRLGKCSCRYWGPIEA